MKLNLLKRRGGLKTALAGRDDSSLAIILTFLARNINDPGHADILIQVTNTLLGMIFSFKKSVIQSLTLYNLMQKFTRVVLSLLNLKNCFFNFKNMSTGKLNTSNI